MNFKCPIDGEPLAPDSNSLRCPAGHTYDRAKEGYYNLLLVQQRASLDPGDNQEMVAARRRFLAAGYYAPIAEKVAELTREFTAQIPAPRILDAGCGEGYYLGRVAEELANAELAGNDISKWAVKAAAKGRKNISWAVASNKQLPFGKDSLDLILCLFGFPFWESFRSVLAPGGHVLLVDPAPEHLRELREVIYETVNATRVSGIQEALALGFRVVREETITFRIALPNQAAIQDLLSMTPHGYRINVAARAKLDQLPSLTTTASVALRVLAAPSV